MRGVTTLRSAPPYCSVLTECRSSNMRSVAGTEDRTLAEDTDGHSVSDGRFEGNVDVGGGSYVPYVLAALFDGVSWCEER